MEPKSTFLLVDGNKEASGKLKLLGENA